MKKLISLLLILIVGLGAFACSPKIEEDHNDYPVFSEKYKKNTLLLQKLLKTCDFT
jgi:hypothetical protein